MNTNTEKAIEKWSAIGGSINISMAEFIAWEHNVEDAIDVKRIYIDMAGGDLVTGIVLSQIIYWHLPNNNHSRNTRLTVRRDGFYWLAKKRGDWWNECRVTERQLDKAVKNLIEKGLIATERYKYSGTPILHIRLTEKFLQMWKNMLSKRVVDIEVMEEEQENNPQIIGDNAGLIHETVISEKLETPTLREGRPISPNREPNSPKKTIPLTETTTENTTEIKNTMQKKLQTDLPASTPLQPKEEVVRVAENFTSPSREERDKSTEIPEVVPPSLDLVDVVIGNVNPADFTGDDYKSRLARAMTRGVQRENSQTSYDLSFVPECLIPLARTFCVNFGRSALKKERGYWIKCWNEQAELRLDERDIERAWRYMRANNLSVTSPGSLTGMADNIKRGVVKPVEEKVDNEMMTVGGQKISRHEFYERYNGKG